MNLAIFLQAMSIIDLSIESAKGGSYVRAPVVNNKIRKNGRHTKQIEVIRQTEVPHVGDAIVRIINDCDPVGFLSDIVSGKAIEAHIVLENGTVQTIYETPTLNKRVEVAKFLAERYLPKVAVHKHAHIIKDISEPKGQADPRTNFEQMVTHAANKAPSSD